MRNSMMSQKLSLSAIVLASACSNDDSAVVTTPAGTNYVVPLADFEYRPNAAWDDGFYDPALVAELVGQVVPTTDGGLLTDGGFAADSGVLPTTSQFPHPIGSLLALWGVVVNLSCAPTVASADNDQDGIPAAYSATFSCSKACVAGDRTSSVTGAVTITNADDNSTTAGLTVTYSNFVVSVVRTNGINRSRTLNGTVSLAPTGSGAFRNLQEPHDEFRLRRFGRQSSAGTYVSTAQATYSPEAGVSNPFSRGTVTFSGQGTLSRNFGGANLSRVVTRTTNPPLHWNRGCERRRRGTSVSIRGASSTPTTRGARSP